MKNTILAFDTNIWIYMVEERFYQFFKELKEQKNKGFVDIIVSDIVKKEWNRNKESVRKKVIDEIKTEYRHTKQLSEFIQDSHARNAFLEHLAFCKDEKARCQAAENRISEIELFMNECTEITVNEQQILYVAQLAIDKQPPMHNNKNNFNDALILRNYYQYVEDKVCKEGNAVPSKYDFIYFSNNSKDFIDSQTGEVYKTIIQIQPSVRTYISKDIADFARVLELSSDLIDDFDDWVQSQLEWEAEVAMGR